MAALNETHDPSRRSWVDAANRAGADFPIHNLPFGVFHRDGERPRGGVAIGDRVVDLAAAAGAKLFSGTAAEAAQAASGSALNDLMALGNGPASALRAQLSDLLREGGRDRARVEVFLVPMNEARLDLPAQVGGFSDFLCSVYHTRRMGGGERPLPPAYQYLPIAYNSRPSSVRVSPEIRRPKGEFRSPDGKVQYGPEPSLDFELECALVIGAGNALGESIPIAQAEAHIFGYCLLNDWSARGIQFWETQPLGPFLGKSFSTSISPWIVTAEALAPFRGPAFPREPNDPPTLPHLALADPATAGLHIGLEAFLLTPRMRARGLAPARLTVTNTRHLYWTFAQMVTHHASNGCNLRPGDLLASGTVSGPTDDSRACIGELNSRGTATIPLPNGESRIWLEDGDEVIFRGRAEKPGHAGIGFGECRGVIVPAEA